jgi:hypothetical protein
MSLVMMMTNESTPRTGYDHASFDDREVSWFLRGEPKRSAILPPEPAPYVPGVDDSIADRWFR